MSPHCDLDLEDTKPVFPHDTTTHVDALACQFWSQKVHMFIKYHVNKHFSTFWTFAVIFNEQNRSFLLNTMACTTIIPRLIEKQSAFQEIFWKQSCFDKWTLTVTVMFKIPKHCSAWLSGLYYGASSYQSPVLQKISSWKTFSEIMNQHCDLDHNNPKRL